MGYVGIDIDDKDVNNTVVQDIIKLFNSYTEYSPSGNGIHIIFTVDIDKLPINIDKQHKKKLDEKYYQKNPHNNIECYIAGLTSRYFTFTESMIENKPIRECTKELLIFLDKYMLKHINSNEEMQSANDNIINIILNSKQGEKFKMLYFDGDITNYNNDDSRADLGLCNILAFFTNGNYNQIDELFRGSALYRAKWDRQEYKSSTIRKAIDSCKQFYNGRRPKRTFVFYTEWAEMFDVSSSEGQLINAICKYVENHEELEIPLEYKVPFKLIKAKLIKDGGKYENETQAKSDGGKKGMEKRWGKRLNN